MCAFVCVCRGCARMSKYKVYPEYSCKPQHSYKVQRNGSELKQIDVKRQNSNEVHLCLMVMGQYTFDQMASCIIKRMLLHDCVHTNTDYQMRVSTPARKHAPGSCNLLRISKCDQSTIHASCDC